MAHEEHAPEACVCRHQDGVIYEIGGSHCRLQRKAVFFQEKIFAVITGCRRQNRQPLFFPDPHFHADCIQQGLITHGLHDPAGPQDGYAALDAQSGIKCLCRKFTSSRNGNRDVQPRRNCIRPVFPLVPQHLLNRLRDHPPGRAVDSSAAHRLVQPGFCHASHALSPVDVDSRLIGAGCCGIDQDMVCDVRIISAVLADGAGHSW